MYNFPTYHFASDKKFDLDEVEEKLGNMGSIINRLDSLRFIPNTDVYGEENTPTIYFHKGSNVLEVMTKGCDLGYVEDFVVGLGGALGCELELLEAQQKKPEKPTFDFGV